MQSIDFPSSSNGAFLTSIPSSCASQDNTIAHVSHNILHTGRTHARKQATPRRALKKSHNTPSVTLTSVQAPLPAVAPARKIQRTEQNVSIHSTQNYEPFLIPSTGKPAAQLNRTILYTLDSANRPSDLLWTEDQMSLLLKFVKEHKGRKSKEFWTMAAAFFDHSRTSEACRKKYYKLKSALSAQTAGNSASLS